MAQKAAKQNSKPAKTKAKKPRRKIDEAYIDSLPLSDEQKAKRKAYRDFAGDKELGDKQFYTWYLKQPKAKIKTEVVDENIPLIEKALNEIKKTNPNFEIKRPGYLITKGRAKKKGEPTPIVIKPAK